MTFKGTVYHGDMLVKQKDDRPLNIVLFIHIMGTRACPLPPAARTHTHTHTQGRAHARTRPAPPQHPHTPTHPRTQKQTRGPGLRPPVLISPIRTQSTIQNHSSRYFRRLWCLFSYLSRKTSERLCKVTLVDTQIGCGIELHIFLAGLRRGGDAGSVDFGQSKVNHGDIFYLTGVFIWHTKKNIVPYFSRRFQ